MTIPMASSTASASAGRHVPGAQAGWWLEDAVPGRVIAHAHGRTIDEAEHVWLAWVTDNVSDVHGNAHQAAHGAFGQPVVLGALTVAIVIGLAEPATADAQSVAGSLPAGWRSIVLRGPVVPGDTLRAESRITAATRASGASSGIVSRVITGYNQRHEIVAVIDEVDRVVPARQEASVGYQRATSSSTGTAANDC